MNRVRLAAIGLVAAMATLVPSAVAWQAAVRVGLPNGTADVHTRAIAVDRAGNVAVGGITDLSGDHGIGGIAVVSRTGRLRWTMRFAEPGSRVQSLHFDRRGDLIVGARINGDDEDMLGWFVVLKLDGRSGVERWRDVIPNDGGAVLVDGAGDAIVGIFVTIPDPVEDYRFVQTLRKLSGIDGTETWRLEDGGMPLAIDARGVLVRHGGLVKRSLDDGRLLWSGGIWPSAAVVDRAGDVVSVLDAASGGAEVTKLSGVDGRMRWTRTFERADLYLFTALAVDAAGDVVVGGNAWPAETLEQNLSVWKLSGTDGSDRWQLLRDEAYGRAHFVVADRKGDVVVSGQLNGPVSNSVVMKLHGRDGTPRWERNDVGGIPALTKSGDLMLGGGGALAPIEPRPSWWLDDAFVVTKLRGNTGRGGRPLPVQ